MFGLHFPGSNARTDTASRGSRWFPRHSLLACGLLAGIAAASPARADSASANVEWVNHPSIIVATDGSDYTEVLSSSHSVEGQIRVELDADVTGRIKNYHAWPRLGMKLEGATSSWDDFKDSGKSETYSSPRPKSVNKTFNFSIPRQDYADFMVAACNLRADELRGQGLSNSQVFAQNRVIQVEVSGEVEAEMTGPDRLTPIPQEVFIPYHVNVVCQRDDSLDPPAQSAILGSYLSVKAVQTSNLRGECELQISGSIISKDPGTEVKFLYVDDKGQTSDLKTVATEDDANVTFKHNYPLSPNKKSGKIRIVGQSHAFTSNWADFESDCSAPVNDIATVLPPKAAEMTFLVREEVAHRGLFCPSVVVAVGTLEGRGKASGGVALFAGGQLKALKQYSLEDGEKFFIVGEQALTWGPTQAQQNMKFALNVSNKSGDLVDQLEQTENFTCRQAKTSDVAQGAAGGFATEIPGPKSFNLSVSTHGEKVVNGYVCPVEVHMTGNMQSGNTPVSGTIAFYAGGSQKKQESFSLDPNWTHGFTAKHLLDWTGAALPEQTLLFAAKVANQHGVQVAEAERIEGFACRKIATTGVAQGAAGGLSTDKPAPLPSQQAAVGQLALQQAPAIAIMAPRGLVRQGQIRLSGGAANATYDLTFYRKSGSGYVAFPSAQLPKQMTGLTAGFQLGALDGGRDWRIEVCPAGPAQGSCKTSDFRLPAIGAKQVQPAPGGATPMIIVPGALQ